MQQVIEEVICAFAQPASLCEYPFGVLQEVHTIRGNRLGMEQSHAMVLVLVWNSFRTIALRLATGPDPGFHPAAVMLVSDVCGRTSIHAVN
jgi:hypothetical protein